MRFASFIARRYLTRGRKYSFISVISAVSILGITIGVAALVVALSLINGFQSDIRDRILSSSAHLMITSPFGDGIDHYQKLEERVRAFVPDATKIAALAYETVLVRGPGRSISGGILRGMEMENRQLEPWLRRLEKGELPRRENDLLVGVDLARKLDVGIGDTCLLIVPQGVASPIGVIPRFKKFRVCGIFRSRLYEFDSGTMVGRLSAVQTLLRLEDKVHYLQINIRHLFDAEKVAAAIKKWLPVNLRVITWSELNASLYSALKLEKTVLFFTLTLIIVVAALNIVAGLFLLVIQKIRDIGILQSYGVPPHTIRRIFSIQGQVIGFLGTATGIGLGLLFCTLANRFHMIQVPYEIYQISYVRFLSSPTDIGLIAAVSLLISTLATHFPARRAAQVNVVDAVKYE